MARISSARSPFSQWRFVVAAGFIVVLAALAAVLALTRRGSAARSDAARTVTHRSASQAAAQATRARHAAQESGGPHRCSLPAGSPAVPTAPPAARWTLEGSMAIPTSAQVGPERHVDGLPVCYAHDPTGALFAAVGFWGAATAAAPARVYRVLAADTPTRAQAIASAQGDRSRLSDSGQVSLAGFTFASYNPRAASVSIVLQSVDGTMVAVTCTMLWQAGDWHYEIPPGGTPPASQVAGLGGYVAWGAAS